LFILEKEGVPVQDEGQVVLHDALSQTLDHLVTTAHRNDSLLSSLAAIPPSEKDLARACWRHAYDYIYPRLIPLLPQIDGDTLYQVDQLLRSACATFAELLGAAAGLAQSAQEAIDKTLSLSDPTLRVDLGSVVVEGSVAMACCHAPTAIPWIVNTSFQRPEPRSHEVLGMIYALDRKARNGKSSIVLVQIQPDDVRRLEVSHPDITQQTQLVTWVSQLERWREQDATGPADTTICKTCPAQQPCWTRWGRTLPDVEQLPRRGSVARSHRPPPASRANSESASPRAQTALTPLPIWLGQERETGKAARLEPSDIQKHLAIFGTSGSGKTCLAKCIIEEAAIAGIPCIVFDRQGDLVQLAATATLGDDDLTSRKKAWLEHAQIRLYTPGSDVGQRTSLRPLWFPEPTLDEATRRLCRIAMAEVLLGGLPVPETWASLAQEYLAQVLETPSGSSSLAGLITQLRNPSELRVEPFLRSRTRRETLALLIQSLLDGKLGPLFTQGPRLRIEQLVESTTPGKAPVNVIWLPGLGDALTQQRFVITLLVDVFTWMARQESSSRRLLIHIDEASPFLPPMGDPSSKQLLRKLLQEDSRGGVGLLLGSHNLTDVDYKLLAQSGTVLLGRLGSTLDKARVRKMLPPSGGFDPTGAAEMLTNATVGRFLTSRISRSNTPLVLQARMPITYHGRPWGEPEIRKHVQPNEQDS
jgi:hypothetical protein